MDLVLFVKPPFKVNQVCIKIYEPVNSKQKIIIKQPTNTKQIGSLSLENIRAISMVLMPLKQDISPTFCAEFKSPEHNTETFR